MRGEGASDLMGSSSFIIGARHMRNRSTSVDTANTVAIPATKIAMAHSPFDPAV
jgi:hypothetical protein